ncbi:MAG: excinuclease ABC subunit UvrC [Bacteroidia bacterium]|nr:excinuclease ABC subunit UvrC [Bacteroidia bacterium]
MNNRIKDIIKGIPELPGVYQYYDKQGVLLYVGKAKNLKKRVSSYFQKEHDSYKLNRLVSQIHDIRTIVVDTELDALLLENNLIKSQQPKYNIRLKDDKTYPWIVITKELFPRIFWTRRKNIPHAEYFGPYANPKTAFHLLEIIQKTFPVRSCTLDLKPEKIQAGKFRPCLDYHIGKCKAPCAGYQTAEEYREMFKQIKVIIKGKLSDIIRNLKEQKEAFAANLEFEKAQEIKEKISLLEQYQARSTIVHPSLNDLDVFHVLSDERRAFVNYFQIREGRIIYGFITELEKKQNESDAEILDFIIPLMREKYFSESKEIIVPFMPATPVPDFTYTIPKTGDKKKLLDLAWKNLEYYKAEFDRKKQITNPEQHRKELLERMQADLRLNRLPVRIEAFDNSNIQGKFAVSAMPVFIDGKPEKKEYRIFNIRTVEGSDDYAIMKEAVRRRYERVLKEQLPLPDLLVIDGGKGQLNAAVEALKELNLYGKFAVLGIAKRLEEIYFPEDPLPIYLDKKSPTLKVIQQIRDEAHRFGIKHYRKKHLKNLVFTELTCIPGIADKTAEKLLLAFGSVEDIKNADLEELVKCIGKAKAGAVYRFYHPDVRP